MPDGAVKRDSIWSDQAENADCPEPGALVVGEGEIVVHRFKLFTAKI
jgi:hypothetical protein